MRPGPGQWLIGIGIAFLMNASWLSAAASEIDIAVEKFVLDNGLTVLVHEDHKAPIVAVGVWYHVGSKDEAEGKSGFAHLFEHIMFEGSENHDEGFASLLEQAGATSLNGTTWLDRTNYFENVPTPALELALWLESDRMGHLLGVVTQEKLDRERGVVQNEKREQDDQPYGRVYYRILEGLFPPGHPYRHSTIGSMPDLNAATLEDVHHWFREYYGAANTVLVLAGDIEPGRGRALAEKYFGDIPAGPPVARLKSWVPKPGTARHEIMYDRVSHVRSYYNWAVPGWTQKDRMLLQLAASVLGEGKNSRLYQALIYEYQHAVEVSVTVQPFELASLFSIETTLASGTSVDQVADIIEQELESFLQDGPRDDELRRARSRIRAGVIRGMEQVGGFRGKASTLAQGELYDGNPMFYKTALSWIEHATATEVRDAARRWLLPGTYRLDVLPRGEHRLAAKGLDRTSGPPSVAQPPELLFPEVQRTRLSNGLNVLLAERQAVPVVSLALQFDAGFAADAGLKPGTASFTLAMMKESTRSRSALEIEQEADSLGAEITTSSDLDTSRVSLTTLAENLAPSIELFADVIRNPAFTPAEMERVRNRWLAAIEYEKSQPALLALRLLPPLVYGTDHPYGIPFTGTGSQASISSLTRDDLTSFHQGWIRPDNATLFVVGDTSMEAILPALESNFGDWNAAEEPLTPKSLPHVPLPERGRVIIIDKPGSHQSLILAAHLAPPTTVENNLDILMMNDIIGGENSSRVNQNLRGSKQWSYGAITLLEDARGQRPWIIYAPVQSDRTAAAVAELIREISRFRKQAPATAAELERVVRSNSYSLPGRYETSAAVLEALQANQRFHRPDNYQSSLQEKYAAIGLEDIRIAAENVLQPELITWVIIGDRSVIQAGLRDLGIAELEYMDSSGGLLESGRP